MVEKEEIEYWDIEDMVDYAIEIYPPVKDYVDTTFDKSKYRVQITRTLEELGHEPRTYPPKSTKKKYLIPKKGAKNIIEDIMYDYFMNGKTKAFENAIQRKRAHHEKVLKDMEIISKAVNEKIMEQDVFLKATELTAERFFLEQEKDESDEDFKKRLAKEELENEKYVDEQYKELEKAGILHKLSDGTLIPEYALKYQLPVILDEEIFKNDFKEKVDSIINHVMLRAIFDSLYNFDEEMFRIDLYERAMRTHYGVSGVELLDGYSEITRRLENPIGNYIFPKKETIKGRKIKKEQLKKATDDNTNSTADNNTVTDLVD